MLHRRHLPGRSLVEYLVKGGQQVFTISWCNPDARHREWGLDTYGQAILDARAAALAITGADAATMLGLYSGGTLQSMALSTLAHRGELKDRVAGFGLAVCVIDQPAGAAGALLDESTATAAAAVSGARGYLDGRTLTEVFAWLRPDDLIWNYWVDNYLQGRHPAPFDILFWNADTTRVTARLHRDFLDLAVGNALLFGGDTRFVLSTSGHAATIVNLPENRKAGHQVSDDLTPAADECRRATTTRAGSWWPDYLAWLSERSGAEWEAPTEPGGPGLPVLDPAPGAYVRDR